MRIAVGDSRFTKKWINKDFSWNDFLNIISTTKRTTETVVEYRKMTKAQQDKVKDVGGFVGGALREGKRRNGHVLCRSMLTLDMDYAVVGVWDQLEALHDWTCAIYSTHKHTPEKPRLRLLIPLKREISEDEYPAVARMVAKEIGIDMFDDSTYEPARLMYWPSTPSDGEFIFRQKEGKLLNPDEYLAKYANWRDISMWPTSKRQSEVIQRSVKKQADPLEKEGVVGAFCRAYSIESVIEGFLSDIYEPSAIEGRYDYILGESSAGVVLYEGKWAYSHHATDPASGKLLNAFDLVRVHKFGELDEKASFQAMCEFAVNDPNVGALLLEERQAKAEADFGENWIEGLVLDKKGTVKNNLQNITLILENDPKLQGIRYNELASTIYADKNLPWIRPGEPWRDVDMAHLISYVDSNYGAFSMKNYELALMSVADHRSFHPIRDYLDELLAWDGVERVDSLLIDYLGAEDNSYVRAVTRKTLVAAVARVFEPGRKFDSVLVVSGKQGIGKSTLFARLGGEWYSDSLSISDMKDKTAPEKLQGYWILELGELAGIKKMDVETVKSFITRVDDKYRPSYGRVVESHPRRCIIVGTTNSEDGFLRDVTGNRRFWPVRVTGGGIYKPWGEMNIDQIWAEALELYRRGEELFLTGEVAALAYAEQRESMEADDREGLVAEYLDTLLPDDWDEMDLYQRRNFLEGNEFEGESRVGTVRRNQVCNLEIWCECFGRPREAIKKSDSYEIEGILNRLGGWERDSSNSEGKRRVALYGPQRVFIRTN